MTENNDSAALPDERDLCGCEVVEDEDGRYSLCRWCGWTGVRENGDKCFHCNGKGHHYTRREEATSDAG